jgi:hypothetical protein
MSPPTAHDAGDSTDGAKFVPRILLNGIYERFGEEMEQTFNDLLRECAKEERGLFGVFAAFASFCSKGSQPLIADFSS